MFGAGRQLPSVLNAMDPYPAAADPEWSTADGKCPSKGNYCNTDYSNSNGLGDYTKWIGELASRGTLDPRHSSTLQLYGCPPGVPGLRAYPDPLHMCRRAASCCPCNMLL